MATKPRDRPASFMYEPTHPPTIPPGMTVADYRRRRAAQSAAANAPPALTHNHT